jgi:hypothetical protein
LSDSGGFEKLPGERHLAKARVGEALRAVLHKVITRTLELLTRP